MPPNLVGYAQTNLDTDYGAVMTSAQFADVAATDGSIALSAITPVADEEIDAAYGVEIQILDNAGRTTNADYMWNGSAWEDANTGSALDAVSIPAGQGLWVASYVGEAVGLQTSGKVSTSDLSVALDTDYGAVAVGNSFPTPVGLSEIMPVASEEVDMAYSVEIQILDNAGRTTDADFMWNGSAWEDANTGTVVDEVSIPAGQGLWVANYTGEAVSLYIPAPEL